ncbi:MAG: NFACT family protein [Negativicutes bacterium]|nr:NFACT family protein [Negativicutes bacterium]
MDGITLCLVLNELRQLIVNARMVRIYQPADTSLLFRLLAPDVGKIWLTLDTAGGFPHFRLGDRPGERGSEHPSPFCMVLRKRLEGGTVVAVDQYNHDRVCSWEVISRDQSGHLCSHRLWLELMGKHSNAVLTDEQGIIIDCLHHVAPGISPGRLLLPRHRYQPPVGQRMSISRFSLADLAAALRSEQPLAGCLLAAFWGLSPAACNNICQLAGLPGQLPAARLEPPDIASLAEAIADWAAILATPPPYRLSAVCDDNGKLIQITHLSPSQLPHLSLYQWQHFSSAVDAAGFAAATRARYRPPRQQQILQLLDRLCRRTRRKIELQEAELQEAADGEKFRRFADLLLAGQPAIVAGQTAVMVADYFSGDHPPPTVPVPVDPALSVADNAARYYRQFAKARRASSAIARQLETSHRELLWLESLLIACQQADSPEIVEEIVWELQQAGHLPKTAVHRHSPPPSAPMTFTSPGGFTVLVGRNNRQNEQVTFRLSRPGHVWLHAQKLPGSHVILQCPLDRATAADLAFAANLAAWFSKGRGAATVAVDYTARHQVKKMAGAKPGLVTYHNFRTITVRPAPP